MNKFVYETEATAVNVGFDGRMGIADIMGAMQYAVMLHSDEMDVGFRRMLREFNSKWVIVKLRLELDKIPVCSDTLHIETWPHKPGPLKFMRSYKLCDNSGTQIIGGISDWCLIDADTFEIKRSRDVYYPEMEYISDKTVNGKYTNKSVDMTNDDYIYTKTVRLSDLDMNGHVNNVSYIQMATDCFGVSEMEMLEIKTFEMYFVAQCFEGDKIDLYKREVDGIIFITAKKDGGDVFRAVINS